MSNNDLKTKLEDHIGYVSINRPPNNHFDAELIGQIADFLEEMDNESECRSIILSSEGKHFCAGADFTRSPIRKNQILTKDCIRGSKAFKTKNRS